MIPWKEMATGWGEGKTLNSNLLQTRWRKGSASLFLPKIRKVSNVTTTKSSYRTSEEEEEKEEEEEEVIKCYCSLSLSLLLSVDYIVIYGNSIRKKTDCTHSNYESLRVHYLKFHRKCTIVRRTYEKKWLSNCLICRISNRWTNNEKLVNI